MAAAETTAVILQLLAAHAGEPMDFVALFMFLNTTDGGHYSDRFSELEIRAGLDDLLASGRIASVTDDRGSYFRLTA